MERATYSVGENGSQLKWLPYRPSKIHRDSRVVRTAYNAPTRAQKRPLRTAQLKASPLQYPFGEPQPGLDEVDTRERINDDVLNPPAADPIVDDLPVALPGDDPSVAEEFEPWGESSGISDIEPPLISESLQFAQGDYGKSADDPEPITTLNPRKLIQPHDDEYQVVPEQELPQDPELPEEDLETLVHRNQWTPVTYAWKASGLAHKPLYFEDVHLERYGHSWGPYLQPVMSGANFFGSVLVLPYKMGLYPPSECIYTLGNYRPGSCAPYMLDPIPLSIRAGLFQAAAWTGGVYLIP